MSPPIKPVPFMYDEDDKRNVPDLDDFEFDHLTAVLKALARGTYPRLDSVPFALNAYNCNRQGVEEEPWAYFHLVTTIPPEGVQIKKRPIVLLDDLILADLKKPWVSIRTGDKFGESQESEILRTTKEKQKNTAQYRFICFIHKHRIDRRSTTQKGVYTISIWDREWDELTYHDTYHPNRPTRRREIKRFWSTCISPGFIPEDPAQTPPRAAFLSRIRYRTVYHTSSRVEDALRIAVPPRHTLWAVMACAMQHMHGVRDPWVGIVPDKLAVFGGCAGGLLPRLWAHLLGVCLDARGGWGRGRRERFLGEVRIREGLGWMRGGVRGYLEGYGWEKGEGEESEGCGDGDGDGDGDEVLDKGDSRDWLYDILKI